MMIYKIMTDYDETIESLVPDFQYTDEDINRIVLTVGFTAACPAHPSARRPITSTSARTVNIWAVTR